MELLSEDDRNLKDMPPEDLDAAWDLWFDLAQTTNDFDPPWTHGVFLLCELPPQPEKSDQGARARPHPPPRERAAARMPWVRH
jgi:hypothetical protein